jgi:recombinational DNA repair ATPase RecF
MEKLMQIKSISIKNYRSIQDVSFDIKTIANKNCHILLGVNESGKSNILKALYLKNPTQKQKNILNHNKINICFVGSNLFLFSCECLEDNLQKYSKKK